MQEEEEKQGPAGVCPVGLGPVVEERLKKNTDTNTTLTMIRAKLLISCKAILVKWSIWMIVLTVMINKLPFNSCNTCA